jgi:predicted acyltransferase
MRTRRLGSIDVIRALTMYLMVFVNDLWTDKKIFEWLEHAPAHADAMGFADIIFPAFLFIVGYLFLTVNKAGSNEDNRGHLFFVTSLFVHSHLS